jgi:hypothetical protein
VEGTGDDPGDAAEQGQHDRLSQELDPDVARVAPRARRSPISDRRSSTAMTMMLADQEGDRAQAKEQDAEGGLGVGLGDQASDGWETLTLLGSCGLAWLASSLYTALT